MFKNDVNTTNKHVKNVEKTTQKNRHRIEPDPPGFWAKACIEPLPPPDGMQAGGRQGWRRRVAGGQVGR